MTKVLFNNISTNVKPSEEKWDISLHTENGELAVFQFCRVSEEDNEFYLELGKYSDSSIIEKTDINTLYFIEINIPEFTCKLLEVKLDGMSSTILPNNKVFIDAVSGTYKELIK